MGTYPYGPLPFYQEKKFCEEVGEIAFSFFFKAGLTGAPNI